MPITISGSTGLSGVDGSSATPALQGTDTNTGISYGTDIVTINTGGTARVTTDASGNLLIGNTSSLYGASGRGNIEINGSSSSILALTIAGSTTNASYLFNSSTSLELAATGSRYIRFSVDGSERMQIDSSGNVGIGTISPNQKLQVTGSNSTGFAGATLQNSNGNVGLAGVQFSSDTTYSKSAIAQVRENANGAGPLVFYVDSNADAADWSAGDEKMRIDSSGNLLVGTQSTVAGARMVVSGTVADFFIRTSNANATPSGMTVVYSTALPNNTQQEFIYCQDQTTPRFTVRSNGGIANYSGNNVNLSDRREKTNFALAKKYLDIICAIPVQTFNYIDQNKDADDGLTLGVVAQDVQTVAPELVTESNWGTKDEPKMRLSIYQTDLQYALMKCIQEQQALIQDLTTRLNTLEGN
jgi:hypothetical protein